MKKENKKLSDSKRSFLKGLGTVAAATPIIGSMFGSDDANAAKADNEMYIKGTYFESCTCDTICPCLLLLDPTKGYCKAFLTWNIEQGHVGTVDVSGLNVSMWLNAPDNLLKGQFEMAVYIDNRSTDEQFNALREAYHGVHGGHLGVIASLGKGKAGAPREFLPTKRAKITYIVNPPMRRVVVGGIAENKMEQLAGANGRPVVVHDTPLAVAPPYPITVSKASELIYNDHGISHSWKGGNGLSSPFVYRDGANKQEAIEV